MVAINSVGPTWEGNQVWLLLGGGAIFAAWPPLYAVSFSGFYLAMFAILFALILRPVAFKYRSPKPNAFRNGTSSLSNGMENCACATPPSMPTEAMPRDFRLAAISALMSSAVNSTSST